MSGPSNPVFSHLVTPTEWRDIQRMVHQAIRVEVHTTDLEGHDIVPPQGSCPITTLLARLPVVAAAEAAGTRWIVRHEDDDGVRLSEDSLSGLLAFRLPIAVRGRIVAEVRAVGRIVGPLSLERAEALVAGSDVTAAELVAATEACFPGDAHMLFVAAQLCYRFLSMLAASKEQHAAWEGLAQRLATLARIGRLVSASLDLQQVFEALIDSLPATLNIDGCLIGLLDEDGVLRTRAYRGVSDAYAAMPHRAGVGLTGTVLATGQPLNVADMSRDPRSIYGAQDAAAKLRAMLCAPLLEGDLVVGVLTVYRREAGEFPEADLQVLLNFAEYAAAAVRNAELYERVGRVHRELGRANRRLDEAQAHMLHSDRLAEAGRVAGTAAHEMRNTLGGIIGAASTVRDQLDSLSPEDIHDLVSAIAEEGWRLRDTIEDMRGYARPFHGDSGWHELAPVLSETLRLLKYDPAFARIDLQHDCADQLEFRGDRDRFKQVMLNLLRNGGDATRDLTGRTPQIRLTAVLEGDRIVLRVIDNGSGIRPEHLEQIWQPFFTTKGQTGTGLGLDVVRQIIREQGGEITVESEWGVGSTFTLIIPGRRASAPAETSEQP